MGQRRDGGRRNERVYGRKRRKQKKSEERRDGKIWR